MSLANEKSWYCTRVLLFILTKMWKKLIDIKGKVCKRKHMQLQQHSNKIHSKIVATTHFMDQIEILRHPSNHDCPRTTETLEIKNPVSLKFFFFFSKNFTLHLEKCSSSFQLYHHLAKLSILDLLEFFSFSFSFSFFFFLRVLNRFLTSFETIK